MAKKLCAVCDKVMGALSMKTAIMDGVICFDCFTLASNTLKIKAGKYKEYDTASLKERIRQEAPFYLANIETEAIFTPSKSIDNYLFIDENNKMFQTGKKGVICKFSDLVGYELVEDGETVTKGGIKGAVVGGLLAGGVGSVVGAIVGNKQKNVCNSMDIKLTVKNTFTDTLYIKFIGGIITGGIKTSDIIYKAAQDNARHCMSALQDIIDVNEAVTG